MTNNNNEDRIFAICEVQLNYPFYASLSKLISMSNVWGIKLVKTNSKSPIAKISIPSRVFKKIMGENPREDKVYKPPNNAGHIFSKLTVKRIEAKDD